MNTKTAFVENFDKGCFILLRAENTVSCVTQTGQNITVLIEFLVQRSTIYLYVRVLLGQVFQALGSGNDAHKLDGARILGLN